MLAGTSSAQSNKIALNDFLFEPSDNLDNRGFALRVVNNTVRQREGRALHAIAAGPVAVDGNFLASLGNHGSRSFSDEYGIGDVVYIQNLGAPWETFEYANILDETGESDEYATILTPHLSPILLNDVPQSPRWFTGLGGNVLFVNNQVVYDWVIKRSPDDEDAPLSFFPNVVLGLDQITVSGNQFAVRLEPPGGPGGLPLPYPSTPAAGAPLFATLFAAGVTTNIELNRFSENISATYLSVLANGDILNTTTLNEATHRIVSMVTRRNQPALSDSNNLIVSNNLILVDLSPSTTDATFIDIFKLTLQDFLKLTFRPIR
jgi:hypothetical protein